MAAAAAAAGNLWRKKLVLHSKRVDIFMGCRENPMPPPPPPGPGWLLVAGQWRKLDFVRGGRLLWVKS
uniref:Uncharacterized protein n=1 Tax=Oryza sativa subsp. japonica TaxID=39947 RepID=Q6H5B6_ORYSJ|nr:hypothetical protein [Oryza sativa Japonica Group]